MIKKAIFIIAFNHIQYTDERLTKEWINHRLDLFEKTTLKCLKGQTNQEFEVYMQCDPVSMEIINTSLSKRVPLPSNIHFDTYDMNRMHSYEYVKGSETTYEIRLDSDNLYEIHYVDRLYKYSPQPETEAIISQNGYVYDINTHDMVKYFSQSPPFYTLIYQTKEYLEGKRYKINGHGSVIHQCKYELLEGNNYVVTLHDSNVSNSMILLRGRQSVEESEKKSVLSRYGLE